MAYTEELFTKELKYRVAMSIVKDMADKGLIDDAEYKLIYIQLANKFQPILAPLCAWYNHASEVICHIQKEVGAWKYSR